MSTSRGRTRSFQSEIRMELDGLLNRLGRVIGRRLLRKGCSQTEGFLKVADAFVEFDRRRPQIESPEHWLVEYLDIGPYDPEVFAREMEEERNLAVFGRRVKTMDIRKLQALERHLDLYLEERKKAGDSQPDSLDPELPWELWDV